MVPPWVTAFHFLAGNTEAELKLLTPTFPCFPIFPLLLNPQQYSTFECCWGYSLIIIISQLFKKILTVTGSCFNYWPFQSVISPKHFFYSLLFVTHFSHSLTSSGYFLMGLSISLAPKTSLLYTLFSAIQTTLVYLGPHISACYSCSRIYLFFPNP